MIDDRKFYFKKMFLKRILQKNTIHSRVKKIAYAQYSRMLHRDTLGIGLLLYIFNFCK